jgi:hypothetical protein
MHSLLWIVVFLIGVVFAWRRLVLIVVFVWWRILWRLVIELSFRGGVLFAVVS